jgi:hypothetical protein
MPVALQEVLQTRADRNQRSLNQEVIFLIETGLAQKSDQLKDTLHMLLKASGSGYPEDVIPPGK